VFDSLADKLQGVLGDLRKKGKLDEESISRAMREIRLALLEADVNFTVVRDFVTAVREKALGEDVLKSLTPGQQVVKVVHDELTALMGEGESGLAFGKFTVILLAGLQGSGKTTAAGKLARLLKSQGLQPLLVGADLQRPAAVEQLRVLAQRVDVPFYSEATDPVEVARGALKEAARLGRNVVIVDTAGRLQIDTELMDELRRIADVVQPHNTLLVVDAMTGQEAVNVAEAFHEAIGLDGVVLTKIDGDARGGAALSVKEVVGKPILFAGTGEKLEDFEPFHPDRMASRILGMGDVLTLIEKAEEAFDDEQKAKAERIVLEGQFTLEDFLEQMQQVKKMGPLSNLIGMMPGLPKEVRKAQIDDREISKLEAIIQSMTPEERRNPNVVNGSRRTRIAQGSGSTTSDVNQLLKQFKQVQKMMQSLGGGMGGGAAGAAGGGKKGKKGKRPRLSDLRALQQMEGLPGLPELPGRGGMP
jgi:signal recognition particle subunit SRP54